MSSVDIDKKKSFVQWLICQVMLGEVDELLLRFLPPCYDAFVVRFLALLLQHMGRLGSVISMNICRLMQENSDDETSDAGSVEMDGNRVLKVLICLEFYTMCRYASKGISFLVAMMS